MKCRLCDKEKEIVQGAHQKRFGSFFDLRLTLHEPICEGCSDRLIKAMFDVGSAIVWNKWNK
jgi:hypothetical protein